MVEQIFLSQTLKSFPRYLLGYVVGFIHLILSDITTTSLFIGALLIGFLAGPLAGLATFFLGYVLLRFVNSLSGAIGSSGRAIANEMRTFNQRHTPS